MIKIDKLLWDKVVQDFKILMMNNLQILMEWYFKQLNKIVFSLKLLNNQN